MIPSRPEYITIGEVLAPRGTKGKIKIKVLTDFPERFAPDSVVYVNHQPMTVASTEWYKGKATVKFNFIDSFEDAERLRGQPIEIHHSQLKSLPEGEYYHFELIGLEVLTTEGELLGKITEILSAKSNDNYIVTGAKGQLLIPAIDDVVKSVDLNRGQIIIEPIAGLLNLNETTS